MEIEPPRATGKGPAERFAGDVWVDIITRPRPEQSRLTAGGETVYTPPGEWHWHGAGESNFMTHLALSEVTTQDEGPAVTWGGHVSDDDYRTACSTVRSPEDPANKHSIQPNPEAG